MITGGYRENLLKSNGENSGRNILNILMRTIEKNVLVE